MKKLILIAAVFFAFSGAKMMSQTADTKATPQTVSTTADGLNKEVNNNQNGEAKAPGKKGEGKGHGKKGHGKKDHDKKGHGKGHDRNGHGKKGEGKSHGKKGEGHKGAQKQGGVAGQQARKGNGKFGNFYALRGLNLSEAQLAKVKELQEKQSKEIEKIRKATSEEREKIRKATSEKMEKINKSSEEELSKILTPAQYLQYKSQLESQQRKSPAIKSKGARMDRPSHHSDSCCARRDSLTQGKAPVNKQILRSQPM